MEFWSLCRTGLTPCGGKPTLRTFRAAFLSCGLPRPFVRIDRRFAEGVHRSFLTVGLDFKSNGLFRCWFLQRVSPYWRTRW